MWWYMAIYNSFRKETLLKTRRLAVAEVDHDAALGEINHHTFAAVVPKMSVAVPI